MSTVVVFGRDDRRAVLVERCRAAKKRLFLEEAQVVVFLVQKHEKKHEDMIRSVRALFQRTRCSSLHRKDTRTNCSDLVRVRIGIARARYEKYHPDVKNTRKSRQYIFSVSDHHARGTTWFPTFPPTMNPCYEDDDEEDTFSVSGPVSHSSLRDARLRWCGVVSSSDPGRDRIPWRDRISVREGDHDPSGPDGGGHPAPSPTTNSNDRSCTREDVADEREPRPAAVQIPAELSDSHYIALLDNVLTVPECRGLILFSETVGYEPAMINVGGGRQVRSEARNHFRCVLDSVDIAARLERRLKDFLPQYIDQRTGKPVGGGGKGRQLHCWTTIQDTSIQFPGLTGHLATTLKQICRCRTASLRTSRTLFRRTWSSGKNPLMFSVLLGAITFFVMSNMEC